MSTPADAPYKVKQRDLRGLLRALFASDRWPGLVRIARPPRAPVVWVPEPTASGRFALHGAPR